MWALIATFVCLASAQKKGETYADGAPVEDDPTSLDFSKSYRRELNETKLINDTQLELGDKYVMFPATPRGAPRNVRAALCPKGIQISGINKRALGCTIGDIFGESGLSEEYLTKLRRWARDMTAGAANNPNAFRPEIDLDLEALKDAHIAETEEKVTKGSDPELEKVFDEKAFGAMGLIPDKEEIPSSKKPWEMTKIAEDPGTELAEEETTIEGTINDLLGGKDQVEIPEEELPWNAAGAPKKKGKGKGKDMSAIKDLLFGGKNLKKLKPEEMPWMG